jgi:competence protein ComGC
MAKKLISVWLSLTILLFSSISIYADENVQGDFFIKKIVINGETIDNNHLQFPFFLYKDTTYFPLTPEMGEILGLKAEMDFESRTLKLLKTEPSMINISDAWKKNEREDVLTQVYSEAQVLAYEIDHKSLEDIVKDDDSTKDETDSNQNTQDTINDETIKIPELSVREIDLAGMPILTKGNVIYLPLKAMTGENGFGWDVYYDPYIGTYISTQDGIPAKSFWNEAESKYNQGLVNYIMKYNGGYTVTKAQELVFLFKNAAKTYKIDEKVLMAVAHKESTFNARSGESGGAAGMMQVMPSTGARYGLSMEQLLDAETSINFGAMYLSERIAAYNGDLVKGFSAYNQGSVAVNRGSFSTRYANRIIGTINGINSYLTSNGYGLGY